MVKIIVGVINGLVNGSAECIIFLLNLLPETPFKVEQTIDNKLLSYISYFLPLQEALAISIAWLGAIVVWYGVQIGLRWVKAID